MATSIDYAELCCRSNFSFLRAASHPQELVLEAARLGLAALAITDCDGVYGLPKAWLAAKDTPLHLIVGAEATFDDHAGLRLLAMDRQGYALLCRLLTRSHADKPKGEAGISWKVFQDEFAGDSRIKGLIAIPRDEETSQKPIDRGVLAEVFQGRLYWPLSRFADGFDDERLERALAFQRQTAAKLIATNDVHYHISERRMVQDILTSVRHLKPLSQLGYELFSNTERHLKSPAEMARLFADYPKALANTLEVAARCRFSLQELTYRYPSEWIPAGHSAQSFLEQLVWQGAKGRYPDGIPEAVSHQLRHELRLVDELRFADYFLTLWEVVEFARQKNILCQGRGSAANSAVCYCLGLTAIDPVRMNLLFERFLSAERGEPPDIDIDFEHERREEVIQHVYERYGRDRAAMVSAVITYRTRSARRDVCRALDIAYETYERAPEASEVKQKVDVLAGLLRDFPRHLSIHSGGFTLSQDALIEIVPVEPARMAGRTIVQWDKYDLDILGLLKVDLLALGMLTALHRALDWVGLTLSSVPPEDPKTYAMIREADTVGVFQIESRAQMNMSGRLLPNSYYDLVIQIAIVRPGPIVGKMVHPYLRRRRGLEKLVLPHPLLEPILGRTLGVPLFQEQVMKMAIVLADFTPGEADQLRRAIGAWRSSGSIQAVGQRLRDGLLQKGLAAEFVDRIFEQIKGFAEYGFPESHSASFALLAYASAYLKCHHPAAFTGALINAQPMGFYAVHTLINDARRHGVSVLPVDPHHSAWDCTLEGQAEAQAEGEAQGQALRLGFRVVRHIHQKEVEQLLAERAKKPFRSLFDFLARVRLRGKILEQLALGDFFAAFGCDQRSALWAILGYRHLLEWGADGLQKSLFARAEDHREVPGEVPVAGFPAMSEEEEVCADYESFALSLRAHPMEVLRKKIRACGYRLPMARAADLKQKPHGQWVKAVGMVIVRQRPPTANGAIFATLEDETGFLDLLVPRTVAEEARKLFLENGFLIVEGILQKDGNSVSLLTKKFALLPTLPRIDADADIVEKSRAVLSPREWQ